MKTAHPAMEPHPLSSLIPQMTDEEYAELVNDIKKNGVRQPITIYEGKILDGRHREKACAELGIVPTRKTFNGPDPLGFVISLNLRRRHLSVRQKAMIAARITNMKKGQRADRARVSQDGAAAPSTKQAPITVPVAAKLMGVDRASVSRARTIYKHALPEVITAVEEDKMSLTEARKRAIAARSSASKSTADVFASSAGKDKRRKQQRPTQFNTPRERQLGKASLSRLLAVCSTFDGICMGFPKLRLDVALAYAKHTEVDIAQLIHTTENTSRVCRTLLTNLRGAK